jgi:hypothetical protein
MATIAQIRARVRGFFKSMDPNSTDKTTLQKDLHLDPREILDFATNFSIEFRCNPKVSQVLACKTVGDFIQMLIDTRVHPESVLALASRKLASRVAAKGLLSTD